jgi:hypothetical protein
LRCAAASLKLVAQRYGLHTPTPSFSTVRWWILRLGCYALRRALPKDRLWVWMIDHTLQIGELKLFVIVGCPVTDVPFGQRDLCLADLRLIALVPMTRVIHETVLGELQKAVARTGVPRSLVSDSAWELQKAAEGFQQQHAGTVWVYDVAHYVANVLENRWTRDPRWQEMMSQISQANQKMRQTKQAHLLAPRLRDKARFMSVGPLMRFLDRVMALLRRAVPHAEAQEKYGWLLEYRDVLAGWQEEYRVVEAMLRCVRRNGVGANTLAEVEKEWGQLSDRTGTAMVVGHMRAYARKYGRAAKSGERLVGSSEALESSFGKLKRLEGDACRGGFTGLVLALGAILGKASEVEVREALEAVPTKEARAWIDRCLGPTITSQRRRFLNQEKS